MSRHPCITTQVSKPVEEVTFQRVTNRNRPVVAKNQQMRKNGNVWRLRVHKRRLILCICVSVLCMLEQC